MTYDEQCRALIAALGDSKSVFDFNAHSFTRTEILTLDATVNSVNPIWQLCLPAQCASRMHFDQTYPRHSQIPVGLSSKFLVLSLCRISQFKSRAMISRSRQS